MLTSPRRVIPYPNPDRTDHPDIPTHILNLVNALELDLVYAQGTHASRPANPGIAGGYLYWETDTNQLFYWDGVAYTLVSGISPTLIDAPGDLIVGTADNTPARLAVGSLGQVLTRISSAPYVGWQALPAAPVAPGTELDYKQITATTAQINATTEATAVAVITGNSVTYDGTKVRVEFFAPMGISQAQMTVTFVLLRDATVVGQAKKQVPAAGDTGMYFVMLDTPSAGAHVYKVSLFVSVSAHQVSAGVGGSGNLAPAFLRVTKV
jgi:hypothetical protein